MRGSEEDCFRCDWEALFPLVSLRSLIVYSAASEAGDDDRPIKPLEAEGLYHCLPWRKDQTPYALKKKNERSETWRLLQNHLINRVKVLWILRCLFFFLIVKQSGGLVGVGDSQTPSIHFSLQDVGLCYNWETEWRLGSYFPLGWLLNWQHLSWPSTLTLAWLWGPRAVPCRAPSVVEASIFQFARGINWGWLSRGARWRLSVNSPSGA